MNLLIFGVILFISAYSILSGDTQIQFLFYVVFTLSIIYGLFFVLPIGGADMPVVISLLNSFTGVAAAFGGFDGNANPINTNEYKPVEDYNPTYNPNAPNSTVGGATGGSTAGAGATGTNNGPGGGTGTPGNGTTPNTQGTPQSAGTNPTGGNIIPDVGIGPKGYQL